MSIRNTAMQQADTAYSAALSHQQAYSEAMSEAERGVQELSLQQGISQSHSQSFVTSDSASAMQALNQVIQQSSRTADSNSQTNASSKGHTTSVGVQGSVGAGLPGVSPIKASASVSGGISENWAHSNTKQQSHATSQESSQSSNYSQNVDHVLRAVSEGSYRASTEEGERLLHNISTSLERAHQEQISASSQFQQAQSYREVASVTEENAQNIDINATQEFMGQLKHSGRSMREVEQVMVNHPQQAQAMADQFVQTRTQEYLENFRHQANATPAKITQDYVEQSQSLNLRQSSRHPIAGSSPSHLPSSEKVEENTEKLASSDSKLSDLGQK